VIPEALEAARELGSEGVRALVVDITSSDRLYREWQTCLRHGITTATPPALPGALRTAFREHTPLVTVHDAASHHLAWLGAALGTTCVPVGVDSFGQSGSVAELYAAYGLEPGSIVNAALAALSLS
jgi:pyruvate dehydrogenase E1 component